MEAATATPTQQAAPPPRLREKYENEILPALTEKFGYSTPMEAPKLLKITLNMGLGKEKQDARSFELAHEQLAIIAGQHPNVRRARKSIAAFKLREGMPVGVSATLRRARMWEFLDRLTSIAVPRIRDFRGLNPRSFDGRGNYSMGIKEQLIFPEIDYDSVDIVRGLDVTITTTAKTDLEAFELLLMLGMPFAQSGRPGQAEREAAEKAAEEEREHEEARLKAETEQAAREELKEENPEAYARPEGDDTADESAADGGDTAAEES
ncbi:MAG: ribosomal protein [Solirubrobacterales bacterium]|jgi:large subunit ribosomal protein L5|nr:ribosomal protein [Solirubrobacterales bacterium]